MATLNRGLRYNFNNIEVLHRLSFYVGNANARYCSVSPRLRILNTSQRLYNSRRFLSTTETIKQPSNIPLTNQSSNILQEKAQNAARLHAELNALLEAQAERQVKESSKPFGSSLKTFFKTNKKEFLNIFAAFMCVLLAWQITTMRRAARRLIDISEEKDQVIQDLRSILRKLHSPDEAFIEKVIEDFIRNMNTSFGSSSIQKRPSYFPKFFNSYSLSNRHQGEENESDEEKMRKVLRIILHQELDKIIGTAAMSNDEIAEKKMADLQKEIGFVNDNGPNSLQGDKDIVNILDSINRDVEISTSTGDISKKSRGFI